ncbi:hypothetical protein AYO39_01415 [Actinobacteria bacterium SCGC AG-212-D09]|nr:hypothetical protein AYO39_01415 [Actinobacteria bacterium SCGC AG-212-D09]
MAGVVCVLGGVGEVATAQASPDPEISIDTAALGMDFDDAIFWGAKPAGIDYTLRCAGLEWCRADVYGQVEVYSRYGARTGDPEHIVSASDPSTSSFHETLVTGNGADATSSLQATLADSTYLAHGLRHVFGGGSLTICAKQGPPERGAPTPTYVSITLWAYVYSYADHSTRYIAANRLTWYDCIQDAD